MKLDELVVLSVWILVVAATGILFGLVGKRVWADAGISSEPLGVRFSFSLVSFIPSLAALVDALLSLRPLDKDAANLSTITFPILYVLNLLAIPIAVCAAAFPPYSRSKLLQHVTRALVALSSLVGAAGMTFYALSI